MVVMGLIRNLHVFVARPDYSIWPVPGVYGAKKLLQDTGWQIKVHDAFLQINIEKIVELILNNKCETSWVIVYVYTHGVSVKYKTHWYNCLNTRVDEIKQILPDLKFCFIGYLSCEKEFDTYNALSSVDIILGDDYDSFCKLPSVLNGENQLLAYGSRKSADFIPANGYRWNSIYQMLDMTYCTAFCENCPVEKTVCYPQTAKIVFDAEKCIKEFENEISILYNPKNICLSTNPLTFDSILCRRNFISNSDLPLFGEIELHFNFNLNLVSTYTQLLDFFSCYKFGALNVEVLAFTSSAQKLANFPVLDVPDFLRRIRMTVGKNTFIVVTLTVGMPGDSVGEVEDFANNIKDLVDVIRIKVISLSAGSRLSSSGLYKYAEMYSNVAPSATWTSVSSCESDFNLWCEQWHKLQFTRPEYRIYGLNPSNILFANDEGFSSDQIRSDLMNSYSVDGGGLWLDRQIYERQSRLIDNYLSFYG